MSHDSIAPLRVFGGGTRGLRFQCLGSRHWRSSVWPLPQTGSPVCEPPVYASKNMSNAKECLPRTGGPSAWCGLQCAGHTFGAAHWRSSVWCGLQCAGLCLRYRALEVQCVEWPLPTRPSEQLSALPLSRNRRARAPYCRAPCWNARMLSVRAKVRTTSVCSGTSCCRRPGLASKEQGARATPAHCLLR